MYDAAVQTLYRSAKEKYICWYRHCTIRPIKGKAYNLWKLQALQVLLVICLLCNKNISVYEV
jgi:hypothetical protein